MLNSLKSPKTKQKSKTIGRGYGSGVGGHTVGRGQKGQTSRTGYKSPRPGFEGGQMPLSRRLPKLRGFKRGYFKVKVDRVVLDLNDLEKLALEKVDLNSLRSTGVLPGKSSKVSVKILSDGEIKRKVEVSGIKVSEKAKQKIEKAGGKVVQESKK